MAPIRTFDFAWPWKEDVRNITCGLGTTGPNVWSLILTSTPIDEHEPREWSSIAVRAASDESPAPTASGNPVFALKNYSENSGMLARLGNVGMIRHTGRRIAQGFVQLEMVEVLVPEDELIKQCGHCSKWEETNGVRFLRCSKCKAKYYCSKDCQKGNWKTHKKLCREGLSETEVAAANTAAETEKVGSYLKDMGFRTMSLNQ
jgi:hypothetical protein